VQLIAGHSLIVIQPNFSNHEPLNPACPVKFIEDKENIGSRLRSQNKLEKNGIL
jgi:hypothetical protein